MHTAGISGISLRRILVRGSLAEEIELMGGAGSRHETSSCLLPGKYLLYIRLKINRAVEYEIAIAIV